MELNFVEMTPEEFQEFSDGYPLSDLFHSSLFIKEQLEAFKRHLFRLIQKDRTQSFRDVHWENTMHQSKTYEESLEDIAESSGYTAYTVKDIVAGRK